MANNNIYSYINDIRVIYFKFLIFNPSNCIVHLFFMQNEIVLLIKIQGEGKID